MRHSLWKYHKLVLKYLLKTETPCRVDHKYPIDQILGGKRDLNTGRKDVSIIFNIFVCLLHSVVLEWRLSKQQGVHDDTDRPNIHLIRVALLFQYLRCDVVRRAAYGLLHIALCLYLGGQAKIAYFCIHLIIDEHISQFQISVDDALTVYVYQSFDYLTNVYSGLKLSQSLPSLRQILQRVISAVLQ